MTLRLFRSPSWLLSLKLVFAIFHRIFIFSPNDSSSKAIKKHFLIHPKSSFRSRDIQIFVIFPFLPTLSRLKMTKGSRIIYDGCHELVCINLQM